MRHRDRLKKLKHRFDYYDRRQLRYSLLDESFLCLIVAIERYLTYCQSFKVYYPDQISKKFGSLEYYNQLVEDGEQSFCLVKNAKGIVLCVNSCRDDFDEPISGLLENPVLVRRMYLKYLSNKSLKFLSKGQIEFIKIAFQRYVFDAIQDVEYADSPQDYITEQNIKELEFVQDRLWSALDLMVKLK